MDKDSKYVDVKNFKIPSNRVKHCANAKFQKYFGFDICLTEEAPLYRSIDEYTKSFIKRDNDMDVYEDSDDSDSTGRDNDEDDENDTNRPMITLTGPFRYEISVLNEEHIDKLNFKGKRNVKEDSISWESNIETYSANSIKNRLDLIFKGIIITKS